MNILKNRSLVQICLAAGLSLGLTACFSDSDDNDSTPASSSSVALSSGTSSSSVAASKNIVEIVVSDTAFSTLKAAVVAAKLDDDLSGAGPFTVFAPTNAAFAKLPAGTLDALLKDPEGALKNILLYHVVNGNVGSDAVVKLTKAGTLGGDEITIEVKDGSVILNGNVKVIATDVKATNGVIHVLDAVLLPPAKGMSSSSMSSSSMSSSSVAAAKTITEIVVENGDFGTLEAAVKAAKLDGVLNDKSKQYTVFAPTDAAFAALGGAVTELLKDPEGQLKDILLHHVVAGKVPASEVVKLTKASTAFGADVSIEVKNGSVYIDGKIKVTATDIQAANGIIHVIDAVILPSITDVVVAKPDFSTLKTAVVAAKLDGTLAAPGTYTVFAPTNAAFDKLPAGTVESLLKDPEGQLKNILLYHVVGSTAFAKDVIGLSSVKSLLGDNISIKVGTGVQLNGSVNVTKTDIYTNNGVIHVLDGVLLPPAKAAARKR